KKNIELILPDKDQYVVTTSEFNQVKALLAQLENGRPSNKPSLRRKMHWARREAKESNQSRDQPFELPQTNLRSKQNRPGRAVPARAGTTHFSLRVEWLCTEMGRYVLSHVAHHVSGFSFLTTFSPQDRRCTCQVYYCPLAVPSSGAS